MPAQRTPQRGARPAHAATNGTIASEPLTAEERVWAVNVGRRLRAEFGALISALPSHDRNGPGLERALGIHRAVAYRLMSAVAAPADLDVLTRIPGVEGLRSCTAAARKRIPSRVKDRFSGAESAVNDYRELIRAVGGSHSRLVRRIAATNNDLSGKRVPTPPGRRHDIRRTMFDAMRALSGRSVAARLSVSIVRPSQAKPGHCEYAHARAYIGYRAEAGGLPLVLVSGITIAQNNAAPPTIVYRDLDGHPLEGRETTGLLEQFCTSPLPIAAMRDTQGQLVQMVDPSRVGPDVPMDAVLAYMLDDVGQIPCKDDPPIFLEALNVMSPAEDMVADLYVHRSLAAGSVPSLSLYLGRGRGNCDLTDRWFEQVHGAPILGLLGSGLGNCHTAAWDRHEELTRFVFSKIGWDPGEFVGYRCEERWPLWNCDYVIALDYRSPA